MNKEIKNTIITELKRIDKAMLGALYTSGRKEKTTLDDCEQMWFETVWHKIIQNRIDELTK